MANRLKQASGGVVWFAVLSLALLVAACSSGGGVVNNTDECNTSSDCPVGEICVDHTCMDPNTTDGDIDGDTDGDVDGDTPDGDTDLDGTDVEPVDTEEKTSGASITVIRELDFGFALYDKEITKQLSIGNSGTENLIIEAVSLRNDSSPDYSFTQPELPITIAPDQTTTLTIGLKPTDPDADEGWLVISSNDAGEDEVTVRLISQLKGIVAISVDPASVEFGNVGLLETASRMITISNGQDDPTDNRNLVVDAIAIEPSGQSVYNMNLGDYDLPLIIPPGESRSIFIEYTPQAEAESVAEVVIHNNDQDAADKEIRLPVSGTGVLPHMQVSPNPVAFGNVKVNTDSTIDVHIANNGQDVLTVTAVAFTDGDSEYLSIDTMPTIPEYGYVVGAEEEMIVTLAFAPLAEGLAEGTLRIESNDPDAPEMDLPVSGSGIVSGVEFDPTSVDFGDVRVGVASTIQVVMENTGAADVTISGTAWETAEQTAFGVAFAEELPITLISGQTVQFDVTCTPDVEAPLQEVLTLLSDNTGGDPQLSLQCNGVEAHIQIAPEPTLAIGEVVQGTTGTGTLTVTNTGDYALTVTSVALSPGGSPNLSVQQDITAPIEAGASAEIIIAYAPPDDSIPGPETGAVIINSDDPDNPEKIINITAQNTKPVLHIEPDADMIDFGNITVECPAEPVEILVRNLGIGVMEITGIDILPGTHASFSFPDMPDSWPVVLQPYAISPDEFTISVAYTPTGTDTHSGWLQIHSNAYNTPEKTYELRGVGVTCGDGQHVCDCQCVANNDVNTCGSLCEACPEGLENAYAACLLDTDTGLFGCGFECNLGYLMVDGACVPANDPTCCGTGCADCTTHPDLPANAEAVCTDDYQCSFQCLVGFHSCGEEWACYADDDTTHCGAECTYCDAPVNGSPLCISGVCDFACNDGFHECNDGQCYQDDDVTHCGPSCTDCPSGPNSDRVCVDGACDLDCYNNFEDCNGSATDGCEADLQTSISHCNACYHPCTAPANATAACDSGSCEFDCNAGYHECAGTCYLDNDVSHCGPSCQVCPSRPNSDPVCEGDACGLECYSGFMDCSGGMADGCETDILSDPMNCNGCTNVCDLDNTAAHSCQQGNCRVQICTPPYGNCDSNDSNGCETNTNTSLQHCGGCNVPCTAPDNAAAICNSGSCDFTCNAGYHRCGDLCYPDNDPNHCGAACINCPTQPNAATSCVSGACTYTCEYPYDDCTSGTGCETNITSTDAHCGACNNNCDTKPNVNAAHCTGGGCVVDDCATGWADCANAGADGCEKQIDGVANTCISNPTALCQYGSAGCDNTICGDESSQYTRTATGFGSAWFYIYVDECVSGIFSYPDLGLTAELVVPAGVDYDLYIYWDMSWCNCNWVGSSCDRCNNASDACNGGADLYSRGGAGVDEVITKTWADSESNDDKTRFWIEVRYYSGESCDPWQLTVQRYTD